MNILTATATQLGPQPNWVLRGIQFLLEKALKSQANWVLYDKSPDLLVRQGNRAVHKHHLTSNSFHHQSLKPFDSVVIAGGNNWSGGSMELLYGLLSKDPLPLYALGLSTPDTNHSLSPIELAPLCRRDTTLSAIDERTRDYFTRYDLDCEILPCPSFFGFEPKQKSRGEKLSIGFQLDLDRQVEEKLIRKVCKTVESLEPQYQSEVFCLKIDEFMRFGTMFSKQAFYSAIANDYVDRLKRQDLLVTTNLGLATVASGVGTPTLLLGDADSEMHFEYPGVHPTPIDHLQEVIGGFTKFEVDTQTFRREWESNWMNLLSPQQISLKLAA